jgi:hypothetical protein
MFGISQRPASGSLLIRNALKQLFLLGPLLSTLPSDAFADEFKLSESQRISCTRGHRAGKLSTVIPVDHTSMYSTSEPNISGVLLLSR